MSFMYDHLRSAMSKCRPNEIVLITRNVQKVEFITDQNSIIMMRVVMNSECISIYLP